MNLLQRLAREPLVHFILLGAGLFAAYALVNDGDSVSDRTIVVDRPALVNYLQYRAAAFEPEFFNAQYDALSEEQLAQLASAYVREEAMEREARALGLDEGDYVIKRRLIQKIEYLVADTDVSETPPDEAELEAYFEANKADFAVEAQYTFTHVFVDAERDHAGGDEAFANRLLSQLQARGAGFNDAPQFGDRFPYERNVVGKGLRYIANQFGPDFAAAIGQIDASEDWQGPIQSPFGYHLVLMSRVDPAHEPALEDVRDAVLAGVMEERRIRSREVLLDELVDQYDVRYEGVPAP